MQIALYVCGGLGGGGEVQVWPATETQPHLFVVAFEFLVEVKEGGGGLHRHTYPLVTSKIM